MCRWKGSQRLCSSSPSGLPCPGPLMPQPETQVEDSQDLKACVLCLPGTVGCPARPQSKRVKESLALDWECKRGFDLALLKAAHCLPLFEHGGECGGQWSPCTATLRSSRHCAVVLGLSRLATPTQAGGTAGKGTQGARGSGAGGRHSKKGS